MQKYAIYPWPQKWFQQQNQKKYGQQSLPKNNFDFFNKGKSQKASIKLSAKVVTQSHSIFSKILFARKTAFLIDVF